MSPEELEDNSVSRINHDMLNQYHCAIIKLLTRQRTERANDFQIIDIRDERIMQLMNNVKKRKKVQAKAQFHEKVDNQTESLVNMQKLPDLMYINLI